MSFSDVPKYKIALEQKDIELIERIIYKNGDDIAVSIARSFEHIEGRIDTVESHIHARIADAEEKIEACREDLADRIGEVRGDVRELMAEEEYPLSVLDETLKKFAPPIGLADSRAAVAEYPKTSKDLSEIENMLHDVGEGVLGFPTKLNQAEDFLVKYGFPAPPAPAAPTASGSATGAGTGAPSGGASSGATLPKGAGTSGGRT